MLLIVFKPSTISAAQTQRNDDQIKLLSEKIDSLVNEAEAAGIDGNVEQAQGLMKLCDQLKEERETLQKQNENSAWSQVSTFCVYIFHTLTYFN